MDRSFCPSAAPAFRAARSADQDWNRSRGARGTSRGAHRRRTRRKTAGFEESTSRRSGWTARASIGRRRRGWQGGGDALGHRACRGSRRLYRRAAPRVRGAHASPPGGGGHGLRADGLGGPGRPGAGGLGRASGSAQSGR
jgi:hypothetical protein